MMKRALILALALLAGASFSDWKPPATQISVSNTTWLAIQTPETNTVQGVINAIERTFGGGGNTNVLITLITNYWPYLPTDYRDFLRTGSNTIVWTSGNSTQGIVNLIVSNLEIRSLLQLTNGWAFYDPLLGTNLVTTNGAGLTRSYGFYAIWNSNRTAGEIYSPSLTRSNNSLTNLTFYAGDDSRWDATKGSWGPRTGMGGWYEVGGSVELSSPSLQDVKRTSFAGFLYWFWGGSSAYSGQPVYLYDTVCLEAGLVVMVDEHPYEPRWFLDKKPYTVRDSAQSVVLSGVMPVYLTDTSVVRLVGITATDLQAFNASATWGQLATWTGWQDYMIGTNNVNYGTFWARYLGKGFKYE